MDRILGYIGRRTVFLIDHVMKLAAFASRLLRSPVETRGTGGSMLRAIAIEQMYYTGVQALPVILPTALIIGSALIGQFARISGQYDLGSLIVALVIRELGPMITALVVILRSATAVTIETAYMQVLHETEALEMAGIDPIRIIGLPRLAGITFAIFCLFAVFDLFALVGGYFIVRAVTHLPVGNLLNQIANAMTAADLAVGMVKAVCFGIVITVVSLYHGFGTRMHVTDIPVVTSRAAIESFFYCLLANIFVSLIFYY